MNMRAAFEQWMIHTKKFIVGSLDPYPAGVEREMWECWQAAWNRRAPSAEQQKPVAILHSDGFWTWKDPRNAPNEANYTGWKMEVYAGPQRQGEPVAFMNHKGYVLSAPLSQHTDRADIAEQYCIPLYTQPRAAVPEAKPLPDVMLASYHEAVGWNACREAMLAAAPAQPGEEKN